MISILRINSTGYGGMRRRILPVYVRLLETSPEHKVSIRGVPWKDARTSTTHSEVWPFGTDLISSHHTFTPSQLFAQLAQLAQLPVIPRPAFNQADALIHTIETKMLKSFEILPEYRGPEFLALSTVGC